MPRGAEDREHWFSYTVPELELMNVALGGVARTRSLGGNLTSDEFDALMAYVGVPADWREDFRAIAWCESKFSPGALGDKAQLYSWAQWSTIQTTGPPGGSWGLLQIHASNWPRLVGDPSLVDPLNPITNLWAGVEFRRLRGRFGGGGGWTCADTLGIE